MPLHQIFIWRSFISQLNLQSILSVLSPSVVASELCSPIILAPVADPTPHAQVKKPQSREAPKSSAGTSASVYPSSVLFSYKLKVSKSFSP